MHKALRLLFRLLKIIGLSLLTLLILLFLAPYLFPNALGRQIKDLTNHSIKGDLDFSSARFSFFTHFPSLTLNLQNVDLKGSAPFQKDTLLSADQLGFGINLKKLIIDHQVSINKIYLKDAYIHVLVDEKGQANYNIYSPDTTRKTPTGPDTSASLHLEKIVIQNSHLVYNDQSIAMQIQAEHFFYEGTGDLSKSEFDLTSHIRTDSLNFIFNHQPYVRRKAIDARLITRVNTQTLALLFKENQIQINKLRFSFKGRLDFLKNGYNLDFSLLTRDADLYQLVTIFPPEYLDWLRQTTVRGSVNLTSTLKGKYIASTAQMPDLQISLNLHDGFVAYQNTQLPITGLRGLASVEMPALDPDKLHIRIDSLSFQMGKDFFIGQLETRGLKTPQIKATADAQLDLENLKKALGIRDFDMRGRLLMHLKTEGKYAQKIIQSSLRKKDTVVASIPRFDFQCSLNNGFIRYSQLTKPVQNIFLSLHAACRDNDYHHAYLKLDTLHAQALDNMVEGKGIVNASLDLPINFQCKVSLNLADLAKLYPLDSLTLSGLLKADINSRGNYAPEHHRFPTTQARISLQNGSIQTKYYPHPLEKINIALLAKDENASLNDLTLSIQPSSLLFEGKSFAFRGDFKNFDDLIYDLSMQGELDLGKIYQVFARKDLAIAGEMKVDAQFKGRQRDAREGHYDLLKNSGSLEVKNLTVYQSYFPKPFLIHTGHFRFDQEKMWFEQFHASYGKSDLDLQGFAENVINFLLGDKGTLKANLDLKSKNIDLNEFSVYASPKSTVTTESKLGVIFVPTEVELAIKADAEKVSYQDLIIHHFQGGLLFQHGEIQLTQTSFELIGCQVAMQGTYAALSPLRARFSYRLQAREFDVHRAYQEIKLFHDLASSAEHASGIISLDYTLSGDLNDQMFPIYPTLKGNGVLSIKNVKFNGWKLFNTVSQQSGKSELKDPDLSKIDVKSSIKNNLITIEKMKFKTGGFRIRFEGQTSFDDQVNFKMRIGLPPLGIIGIPVRITGKAENPKIKMSNSDTDPLEEKAE